MNTENVRVGVTTTRPFTKAELSRQPKIRNCPVGALVTKRIFWLSKAIVKRKSVAEHQAFLRRWGFPEGKTYLFRVYLGGPGGRRGRSRRRGPTGMPAYLRVKL